MELAFTRSVRHLHYWLFVTQVEVPFNVTNQTTYRHFFQDFQTTHKTISNDTAMLPPVDPLILSTNPKFSALYSDLCNNKLNRDGTSKLDAKAQRDHNTVKEVISLTSPALDCLNIGADFIQELHQARVEAAKRDLVKSGLQELSYRPDALPEAACKHQRLKNDHVLNFR